jgi:hypothetical protein
MRLGASWVWIAVGVVVSSCGGESERTAASGGSGSLAGHGTSGGIGRTGGDLAAGGSGGTAGHFTATGGGGAIPDGSLAPGGIGGIDAMLQPAGSGGQAGHGPAAACSFTVAPPAPAAVADSAPLDLQGQAQLMSRLDALVGRFLRGDAAVYRGRMNAHDNAGEVFNGEVDGVIPDGPALASLVEAPLDESDFYLLDASTTGIGAFLSLHGVGTGLNVCLEQAAAAPDVTNASFIAPDAEDPNSLRNTCDACAPSLWHQPSTMAFGEVDASGSYNGKASHVSVGADLERAAPCSLSFDDLVTMSGSALPNDVGFNLHDFSRSGHEMVQHMTGYVATPDANPTFGGGGADGGCFIENYFDADLYINLDDLSDYGVRNLTFKAPEEFCTV